LINTVTFWYSTTPLERFKGNFLINTTSRKYLNSHTDSSLNLKSEYLAFTLNTDHLEGGKENTARDGLAAPCLANPVGSICDYSQGAWNDHTGTISML